MLSDQLKTEAVKQCFSCAAAMPESDNFCRCCGISQRGRTVRSANTPFGFDGKTKAVSDAGEASHASQMLSSMLVNTLAQSVAIRTMPLRCGRFGARVIAGLVVIPMWLLIILLSPLDAYAAAKAASSQLNYE